MSGDTLTRGARRARAADRARISRMRSTFCSIASISVLCSEVGPSQPSPTSRDAVRSGPAGDDVFEDRAGAALGSRAGERALALRLAAARRCGEAAGDPPPEGGDLRRGGLRAALADSPDSAALVSTRAEELLGLTGAVPITAPLLKLRCRRRRGGMSDASDVSAAYRSTLP